MFNFKEFLTIDKGNLFKIDKRDVVIALLTVVALILFVPIFTYAYFAKDLGSKETIMNLKDTGVVLLDDQNKPFFTFYQGKVKSFVPISKVPRYTQEAFIASEDKNFYSEPGFSVTSIIRSAIVDARQGDLSQGGSTITQQLVKNSLLNSNKNVLRKYQEITLADEINRRYSKQEILEMYVNSVYFGQGAFGIEEAAKTYFGKDAQDLTLAQSAFLVGLLPAPSEFSPYAGHLDLAKKRQQDVLQRMADQGYISPNEKAIALSEQLKFNNNGDGTANSLAPHFALMVLTQLQDKYGEEEIARSGFKVHTSLNSTWQAFAQQVVAQQVVALKGDNVSNGAVVVEDPKTGEIKALVGSKDWYDDQFGKVNMATSPRQPGSSFKPIVYSTALQQRRITPATVLQDTPHTFNQCQGDINPHASGCDYKPNDYDNRFWGPITVRQALANSRNIPAVEVMQQVGVAAALNQAQTLGITSLGDDPSKYGLALVLGAGEVPLLQMTNVYAAFANSGQQNPPTIITQIDDKFGTTIYKYNPNPQQVLDPGVAYLVSSILSDPNARAREFGTALNIPRLAAVKTGTTSDYKDSWTLGYTPSLVVGVWVGNNDNAQMDGIAGSLGAAPIWRSLMEKFLAGTPIESFPKPDDVVASTVCGNVKLANEASNSAKVAAASAEVEYFLAGTQGLGCVPQQASQSGTLAQSTHSTPGSFTPSPTDENAPGDCTGPDGKHMKVKKDQCIAFNKAWAH